MQKIDLSDVTFIIPFKKDSDDRLRNLRIIIAYLNQYFTTNIHVMEEDATQHFTDMGNFKYTFVHNPHYAMRRTRCLNLMAKEATTPIIANYDTDVLLSVDKYVAAAHAIRNNHLDMVYPYGGPFVNYLEPLISRIENTLSVDGIRYEEGHLIHPNSLGGAIFFRKSTYLEFGGENENFVSWGWEDNERFSRFSKMGARIGRVQGHLIHLNHPPSANSANTQHDPYNKNMHEYHKVGSMSREQLVEYINTFTWNK